MPPLLFSKSPPVLLGESTGKPVMIRYIRRVIAQSGTVGFIRSLQEAIECTNVMLSFLDCSTAAERKNSAFFCLMVEKFVVWVYNNIKDVEVLMDLFWLKIMDK